MSANEKGSRWSIAFELMKDVDIPSVITWNAFLSACQKGGCWEVAIFGVNRNEPNESDLISYNAAISACEEGEEWEWALQLLTELEDGRLHANEITCCAVISACGRCREWQKAIQLLLESIENR